MYVASRDINYIQNKSALASVVTKTDVDWKNDKSAQQIT